MDKIVKELNGHSGSNVLLIEGENGLFVRKINNVEKNVERLKSLAHAGYPVPKILFYKDNVLDMEYLHGLDMKNYLIHNTTSKLQQFIVYTIDCFMVGSFQKDYTDTYYRRLEWMDLDDSLPFTKEQLISRLPKVLPCSMYHGDMTLENIMYTDPGFHLIDGTTTEYDSYVFDIAKMRQDLECKWFLRKSDAKLGFKLQNIQDALRHFYPEAFNDSLLILMLLRVYLHTIDGDLENIFIRTNLERLWKNIK